MYASFWKRLLAYCLDLIVVWLIFFVLESVFYRIRGIYAQYLLNQGASIEDLNHVIYFDISKNVALILILIICWLYFALMESSGRQATWGKKWVGLIVVNERYERLRFGKASKRFWSKMLSSLILCMGYIMVFFTQYRQSLHDKIAKTYVVNPKQLQEYLAARDASLDAGMQSVKAVKAL
ncbi:RDD family protein [Paenibacillus azoreducens]|uniref:RDD family protein n=1 Tax=Paenibacillus azoreducens TaxID=116718 RepID=UPI0039F501D6